MIPSKRTQLLRSTTPGQKKVQSGQETRDETPVDDASDGGSSPVEDPDHDDYDQQYLIRLTPYEKYTMDEVIVLLKDISDRWIVTEEFESAQHFHVVICCDYTMTTMRRVIREFLRPYFADPKTDKFVRGFGNTQYNAQECEDIDLAISYCLKTYKKNPELKYEYVGFTEEYINARKEASFEKKSKDTFKAEFYKLREEFSTINDYMIKYVKLCSKYERMVNMHHAYQYAMSAAVSKDESVADQLVGDYLNKI